MSVHKCPVCEGRGQVPAGFYYINSAPTAINTSPEICKSCHGKGVIFEYEGNDYNNPYQPVTPYPYDFNYSTLIAINSCSNCGNNDGMVYTSNPVKYRCTLTGEWHYADHKCDSWCHQTITLLTGTNVSEHLSEYLKMPILNATDEERVIVEYINETNQTEFNRCDGCFHQDCCTYFDEEYAQLDDTTRFVQCCVGCPCGDGCECNRDNGCSNYDNEASLG